MLPQPRVPELLATIVPTEPVSGLPEAGSSSVTMMPDEYEPQLIQTRLPSTRRLGSIALKAVVSVVGLVFQAASDWITLPRSVQVELASDGDVATPIAESIDCQVETE